jgi:hypothetical protein
LAHTLNLVVHDLLSSDKENAMLRKLQKQDKNYKNNELSKTIKCKDQIANLIQKCRKFVGAFRHSEPLNKFLKETQERLNTEFQTKLVQDVSTRWNSTYDLLDSLLINQDALNSVSLDAVRKPNLKFPQDNFPTPNEFDVINEICLILYPIKELTETFSGQNYCTLPIALPCLYTIINIELPKIQLRSNLVKELRSNLISMNSILVLYFIIMI